MPDEKPIRISARQKAEIAQRIRDYAGSGARAGCPPEQIENFLKASVWLQPKQLEIASACRECDQPNGPKDVMAGGGRGAAKCLDIQTPILTNNGWKTMGEVHAGDFVFDEKGKQCKVVSESEIFINHECFEFEFDSGEKVVCDSEHLWLTISKAEQKAIDRRSDKFRAERRLSRGKKSKPCLVGKNILPPPPKGTVKSASDIFKSQKCQKGREVNHRIPVCFPLEFTEKPLPIHPYLLGVWLGDGSATHGRITSDDPEILETVNKCGYLAYKMNQKFEWRVTDLTTLIRKCELFGNKHIPKDYFDSSITQRKELVRGLMDTDGCADKLGRASFVNTNTAIIHGMVALLRSLGIKATITSWQPYLKGKKCSLAYRIHFTPNFNCFHLKRKSKILKLGTRKTNLNHYIVSVKKVESRPVKCISVDSESHLFLCGNGLIPTHNTHAILAVVFCDDCQRMPGLKVLVLRKVGRANKEQIEDFRKKLLSQLEHNYKEQQSVIHFPNGSMVVLGNFKDEKDIDKYLGLEYDAIHIVESNQLTPTKKTNILSCLRTNKTNWRPRCYEDTNPGGISHHSNKMLFVIPFREGKQTETRYIHCTIEDNSFVDKGYKEYLEKLVGWQREAWLHGSWDFMAGAFFTNWTPDIHVFPNESVQFNVNTVIRWFGSMDYGFTHPNSFGLHCECSDGNFFTLRTYNQSETLIQDHCENIRDMLRLQNLSPDDLEYIAAGRDCFKVDKDGSTVATEYAANGIHLTPVQIDRVNGWSKCQERLGDPSRGIRPTWYIHKSCEDLALQISLAQADEKRIGDVLKMNANESGDGGDDVLEMWRNSVCSESNSVLRDAKPIKIGNHQSTTSQQTIDIESMDAEDADRWIPEMTS